MDFSKTIAEKLLDIEAVKVKMDPPFSWTSGIKSPVYCDNRRLISYPEHRKAVVMAWKQLIEARVESGEMEMPDVLGGTATAAIPWAAFLAYEMNLPMVYIRPQKKEHGAGKQIEGDLKPGQKVLIVEDLISTGGSSVAAAEAVRDEGQCEVTDIFAIVSWELQKSEDRFDAAGLRLTNLTGFAAIIGLAAEIGSIKPEDESVILEFKKDPPTWAERVGL
ncbi:orotate phosphoribosyltransferase [Candidatus Peregrinibacteria bacterium]|jgi:orotate phosphoribosyltransferase|nr:orotate phosphoribosyltransferase [Candidatus Peregrinibacteria bacterium]MBT7484468.1 orotate phosphoribosyltransferase [Candidatus Peregrinibacteria bacterium]MBT7702808.1 orotate phosphoribosyltransferase [Candidatus Peregrinibacteria bacterium]